MITDKVSLKKLETENAHDLLVQKTFIRNRLRII